MFLNMKKHFSHQNKLNYFIKQSIYLKDLINMQCIVFSKSKKSIFFYTEFKINFLGVGWEVNFRIFFGVCIFLDLILMVSSNWYLICYRLVLFVVLVTFTISKLIYPLFSPVTSHKPIHTCFTLLDSIFGCFFHFCNYYDILPPGLTSEVTLTDTIHKQS